MYHLLIVDDDKIERDGVKFLLNEYQLPFAIAEAPNGKAALSHLHAQHTDVLLTDIKMPFVDGLELAQQARALNPNIKIVIFSAYGEFEYAKKAIELKAIHYILKPIDIPEFLHVMQEVLDVCREEDRKRQTDKDLAEVSSKAERYEKEKLLMRLISGAAVDDTINSMVQSCRLFERGNSVRIVLVDIRTRFFDRNNDRFLAELCSIVRGDFEYINLNERQSVLFLKQAEGNAPANNANTHDLVQKLQLLLIDKFNMEPCLAVSMPVYSAGEIGAKYNCLEDILNYRFYNPGSLILYSEEKEKPANHGWDSIDDILEDVKKSLYLNEIDEVKAEIIRIVDSLKQGDGISPIYAKSVFIDIIKLLHAKKNAKGNADLGRQIDTVIRSQDIECLKNIIFAELSELEQGGKSHDFNRKTIQKVQGIVHSKYREDINLEWIADQIHLSAGYLSCLFKKETGISLIKYIAQYRLEKAKELLDSTNLRINDIAESVGYPDPSYFSMVFKTNVGMSPNRYRERSR